MVKELCKNCIRYKAYYKQRDSSYEKLNYGFCSKQNQQHKGYETCDSFKYDELKEKRRKASLYLALE